MDSVEIHMRVVTEAERIFDDQILEGIWLRGFEDEEYTVLLREVLEKWRKKEGRITKKRLGDIGPRRSTYPVRLA